MGNLQTFSSHFSKRTNIVEVKRSTVFLLFTESVQVPIHKEGVCCQLIRPAFGNFFPLQKLVLACLPQLLLLLIGPKKNSLNKLEKTNNPEAPV